MSLKHVSVLHVLLTAGLFIGPMSCSAAAQEAPTAESGPLAGSLECELVLRNAKTGEESFVEASKARPGDELRYTVDYRSKGKVPLNGVELVVPVPAGTLYVAKSATPVSGASIRFSVDGGRNYQTPPLKLEVIGPKGKRLEPAGPEKVTHVKWKIGQLAADERFVASCRVKLK